MKKGYKILKTIIKMILILICGVSPPKLATKKVFQI